MTSSLSGQSWARKQPQRILWKFCRRSVVGVTTDTRPRPAPSGVLFGRKARPVSLKIWSSRASSFSTSSCLGKPALAAPRRPGSGSLGASQECRYIDRKLSQRASKASLCLDAAALSPSRLATACSDREVKVCRKASQPRSPISVRMCVFSSCSVWAAANSCDSLPLVSTALEISLPTARASTFMCLSVRSEQTCFFSTAERCALLRFASSWARSSIFLCRSPL
mmetsp:Transcript_5509/g.15939  ORF Transcript_5509/g.15939 Transcript_5509/m.15939 type:complete len:224 (+) Transcript_5509:801-1472(+)